MADSDEDELAAALALSMSPLVAAPAPAPEPAPAEHSLPALAPADPAQHEAAIQNLCDMGFPRDQVALAMQCAFMDPDRAVQYLTDGIPPELLAGAAEPEQRKLVALVRTDLGMSTGKVAAQVAHGVLAAYRTAQRHDPHGLQEWCEMGEPTIVLQVATQQRLHELLEAARAQGLPTHCVADAGRTQVAPGSETVGCVGPALKGAIDAVTGALSLL
jgi:PTH2 family peptidyl-tRNA hydrolase